MGLRADFDLIWIRYDGIAVRSEEEDQGGQLNLRINKKVIVFL